MKPTAKPVKNSKSLGTKKLEKKTALRNVQPLMVIK
jgi:hypothetical protein